MAVPVISNLPPAPTRSDGPADFTPKADALAGALQPMVVQYNASLVWVADKVNAAQGYASSASSDAGRAEQAAASAASVAASLGSQAALPSLAGNARRALAVNADESGVSFQTLIQGLFIEPGQVSSVGGPVALNISTSGMFSLTLTAAANISFTLPSLTASQVMVFVVEIQQGSTAFAVTWPASVVWTAPGGIAPATPNAGKRTEYIFTVQGGTVKGRKGASN